MTAERTGQTVQFARPGSNTETIENNVHQLLSKPLTPDTAVQIALQNNRALQASLAELGIAESDLVQAGRMRNPGFSFGRMRGGDELEIERGIMFDIVGLLTIPIRRDIEGRRFEQARLQAASQAVRLVAETRKAYFNAVAAQQTAQYMEQVGMAAEASAELAKRMAKVGNWSKLDQAREQAFHADATAQIARAKHNAIAAREQLARLMGVWGAGTAFQLPDRLPDLPKEVGAINDIEAQAMRQRLDIQMAKYDTEATASALGLTKATGFINVLHAGYANKSTTDAPRENGYEIELELPIFDWGGAKTARAEAVYMQSLHRTADIAVRARSEVRESYSAYRTSYDLAKHYRDEVVPLRKRISDEMLLRYNGMLASVFELLADARDQINSVNAAIEAQRDFWVADTDLQSAVNGTGGASTPMRGQASSQTAAQAH
ncbi:TolC family protein [Noviherbaspirillum cavernae]|uniref:TolC family protein n=2 Tax=Noviherbaspirillum cavernae TaxID=2320862 RepID=A0A418X5R2_9BURK|nr:TolC family protein [Noviherbaspirillum cavernae]